MQCAEFELALQRQLDGESVAIEHERLREHALSCDSCRELQEGTRLLMQGFASVSIPPVSPGLADRICEASSRIAPRSRIYPRVRAVMWLAAAIVLGAVGLGIRWLTLPQNSIAMNQERQAIQTLPKAPEVLFPELAGPDAVDSRESMPIMVAVEPVSRLFQAVGRSLGDPVRPIAVSTSEAMSNLIKDLPDTETSAIPIPMMRDIMSTTPGKKMQGMPPSS
jgi:hypothetical protein